MAKFLLLIWRIKLLPKRRLKGMLKESALKHCRDTDLDLLRFVGAHSFNVGKARAMYGMMVECRQ